MEYQALYRRWRPRNFTDFVGQSHVVTTLYNAIQSRRIAHAYLFTGPRGTGKTSIAKIFAKAINCAKNDSVTGDGLKSEGVKIDGSETRNPDPCDQCSSCVRINEGTFMDVLEIDAASNRGVDEIRDLREKVKFSPSEGRYKIYIIDEVHMLTTEAFNALLKTLEEPPQFVVFILATTEVHKIPPTILSRCQRFDFKRFTNGEIAGRLRDIVAAEGLQATDKSLELIASHSEGGMRDALSLLEQAMAHSQGQLTEENVRAILGLIDQEEVVQIVMAIQNKDLPTALNILSDLSLAGKDLFQFGRSLIGYLRELLLAEATGKDSAFHFKPGELVEMIEVISNAAMEVKRSLQSALPLELAFIKLTSVRQSRDELEARVARLEALLQNQQPGRDVIPVTPMPVEKQVSIETPPVVKKEPVSAGPSLSAQTATPTPQVVAGDATQLWDAFLEAVKNKKRTLGALVQEGKAVNLNHEEFVMGIPENMKFHLENINMPQNKELLEGILTELCGRPMKMTCVPLVEGQPIKTAAVSEPAQPDLVKKTIELFGGEARPISEGDH